MRKRLNDTEALAKMPGANMLLPAKYRGMMCDVPCEGDEPEPDRTVGNESLRDAVNYLE